jgi:shikimate dehydrogenase
MNDGYAGLNITVPHKEMALEISSNPTERAKKIGAANTLIFKKGKIYADNTDGIGFLNNLTQLAPGWKANLGPAVVLGAGGASRSIVYSLLNEGAPKVILTNRTYERAKKLANTFGEKVLVINWENINKHISGVNTLINTTTLGMLGSSNLEIDLSTLSSNTLVTDIVYNPLKTPLLENANRIGCKTVDGLGMLLHQAVPGFKGWFGVEPKVDSALRDRVLLEL